MGNERTSSNGLLEEEEETQLQSSLPLYLDNVFGVPTHTPALCQEYLRCEVDTHRDKHTLAPPHCCMIQTQNEPKKAGMDEPCSVSGSIETDVWKQAEQRYIAEESGSCSSSRAAGLESYVCPQVCTMLSACANIGAGKLVKLFCIVMQGLCIHLHGMHSEHA